MIKTIVIQIQTISFYNQRVPTVVLDSYDLGYRRGGQANRISLARKQLLVKAATIPLKQRVVYNFCKVFQYRGSCLERRLFNYREYNNVIYVSRQIRYYYSYYRSNTLLLYFYYCLVYSYTECCYRRKQYFILR